ncbi:MAG: SIMPL domain-containing protein [Pseudomonadota bacterium]
MANDRSGMQHVRQPLRQCRQNRRVHLLRIAALGLLLSACAPDGGAVEAPVAAQQVISVSGTGVAAARPDIALSRLGVTAQGDTAQAAMAANNTLIASVLQSLRKGGVEERDLNTLALQLQPRYERQTRAGERQVIGYTATNVVEVKIRDIDAVGRLLDRAIEAGANRVDSLRFQIADPTPLLVTAREAAWQNALAQAQQLATLAGVKLGSVTSIRSYQHSPGPVHEVSMARAASNAVPIAAGSQSQQVTIEVSWAIE